MQHGIVLLEFRPHERVEVVAVEVGLGPFGEIFHGIVRRIVADLPAVVVEHFIIDAGLDGLLVRRFDARLIKAGDLVVVSVDRPGMRHGAAAVIGGDEP